VEESGAWHHSPGAEPHKFPGRRKADSSGKNQMMIEKYRSKNREKSCRAVWGGRKEKN